MTQQLKRVVIVSFFVNLLEDAFPPSPWGDTSSHHSTANFPTTAAGPLTVKTRKGIF